MLFPVNTDAPIYHFPGATIGIIVVNVVCCFATAFGRPDLVNPWLLEWGNGLHPVQWVTSNFMHAGFLHLLGNMIFLWGFGLVVEGKLGWWRFIGVYMAIGITQCAIEQTLMLGYEPPPSFLEQLAAMQEHFEDLQAEFDPDGDDVDGDQPPDVNDPDHAMDGNPLEMIEFDDALLEEFADAAMTPQKIGSLGASAIIYGILAMSLVWAPKNDMSMVAFFGIRVMYFEVMIMTFSFWYIGLEMLGTVLMGLSMGSGMMHVMGAFLGFGVGVVFLKKKWVDCEDWDLFSVLSGRYGSSLRDKYGYRIIEEPIEKPDVADKQNAKACGSAPQMDDFNALVDSRKYKAALRKLEVILGKHPNEVPDEDYFHRFCNGLLREKQFEQAELYLEDYIEAYPENDSWAHVSLAGIQFQVHKDARLALETLELVLPDALTDKQKSMYRKLGRAATAALRGPNSK